MPSAGSERDIARKFDCCGELRWDRGTFENARWNQEEYDVRG
jgi:hypothetical protein